VSKVCTIRAKKSHVNGANFQIATASNAFGLLFATRNKVCAAPVGSRRPCYHTCKVRTDTPSDLEKLACDKSNFARACAAGVVDIYVTRPYCAFNPRMDGIKFACKALILFNFHLIFIKSCYLGGNIIKS
jgi:hypothetical protein